MHGADFEADEIERGRRAVEAYDLAREIADEVADFDVKHCAAKVDLGEGEFYDTNLLADEKFWKPTDEEMRARVQRAARYLIAKGRARQHPVYAHVVEILPDPGAAS